MPDEPIKIILRRLRDRPLESGLLIVAIALGIGAFSAGLSLVINTAAYSGEIMRSPQYHELIVSTRSEADEMETPVAEKPARETAVLTMSDLDAAELAPHVTWAYVQNHYRLHLVSSNSDNSGPPEGMEPPERLSEEDLAAARADANIILSDLDEISGYQVTPEFFDSWEMTSQYGTLFSEMDSKGTDNLIVLGAGLAELIAGEGIEVSEMLGKKLLTREGYQTVIGILDPVSDTYDAGFFSPFKDLTGGMQQFRRRAMDTQLRFAVDDPAELDTTAALLGDWFSGQFGEDQITISNPRAEALQLVRRNTGIGMLILFLAGAGLFIALVNVSNILMSRVLRMKKSVGILMALGSSKAGIMRLFLAEALILAAAGGAAGALIAVPLGGYMRTAAGIETGTWLYLVPGIVLSGFLTTLFGLIPSRQYLKIDPAQAMRSVS